MTYNDIHRAVVNLIKSTTGAKAISLENKKEKQRGGFKLVEDAIRSERVAAGGYRTVIPYILGFFPESEDEYKEECIKFLEAVQQALLVRGITIPGEAHIYVDEVTSDIDTDYPALIMTFDVSANMKYADYRFDENENNEYMEDLKGDINYADTSFD